jgi:hypothetical protein
MTKLTDAILAAYAQDGDDTTKLTKRLTERRRATWINTLAELASKHGCNKNPGTPKGADARKLAADSKRDAESVINTFNTNLQNEIKRLVKANPKGNRAYYASNISKWVRRRAVWKNYQIALMADTTARQYATERFYTMNKFEQRFVYSSIPPVSKECIKRSRKGIVNFKYVQTHPVPSHVNCPHTWIPVSPQRADCEILWVG